MGKHRVWHNWSDLGAAAAGGTFLSSHLFILSKVSSVNMLALDYPEKYE